MSTNDYVKYVTQQIVSYIDQPKEERKKYRQKRKNERTSFGNRWFGVLPFAFSMFVHRKIKTK
ncbi:MULTISPECIES: YqzE family protein [Bacillaceae]|uniref:YqzE family protein n=1 Tax=Bacillaceae TaxID=186817 RepID=UPI001BDE5099|nr:MULTISPECIES: YqzE family protein [Bacillaceae]MDX8359616.1 YqzE family protein [Cytobacillus sp. IB215316]